jgi:hypothetical protein
MIIINLWHDYALFCLRVDEQGALRDMAYIFTGKIKTEGLPALLRNLTRKRPGPRRNAGDGETRGWPYSVSYSTKSDIRSDLKDRDERSFMLWKWSNRFFALPKWVMNR